MSMGKYTETKEKNFKSLENNLQTSVQIYFKN